MLIEVLTRFIAPFALLWGPLCLVTLDVMLHLVVNCFMPHPHTSGSGKTRIAAEVLKLKLPELKGRGKAAVFLAPTNPLVIQVSHLQAQKALNGLNV